MKFLKIAGTLWSCISLLILSAAAQSPPSATELLALKDHVLTLRNFSRSSQMPFDENGVPRKIEESVPWTVYAQFQAETVDLNSSRLLLRGPRH